MLDEADPVKNVRIIPDGHKEMFAHAPSPA
jgi:hypothetical protein